MLEDLIRKNLMLASKDRNILAKNILSLALGEIQTSEARGKTLSEKDKLKLIKELLKFKYTKIPLTQIELMLEELDL